MSSNYGFHTRFLLVAVVLGTARSSIPHKHSCDSCILGGWEVENSDGGAQPYYSSRLPHAAALVATTLAWSLLPPFSPSPAPQPVLQEHWFPKDFCAGALVPGAAMLER